MRIDRRRWVQGLLLSAPPFSTAVHAAVPQVRGGGGATRLRIGIDGAPGSGNHALAQQLALRLGQLLPQAVVPVALQPGTEPQAWCAAESGAPRVVLATRWRSGATGATGVGRSPASARLVAGLVPLGVLAREPLALLAGRSLPAGWAAVRDAARRSATPWRCGIDGDLVGDDSSASDAALRLLTVLGVGPVEPVLFRGPSQLLPAVVGDRLPLAWRSAGQWVGTRWHPLSTEEHAGNLVDPLAAHRRGELQLLAVADRQRLPGALGVPTLSELLAEAAAPAGPTAAPDSVSIHHRRRNGDGDFDGTGHNDIGRCLLLLAPADLEAGLAGRLRAACTALAELPG